jgi:hypothetical protein
MKLENDRHKSRNGGQQEHASRNMKYGRKQKMTRGVKDVLEKPYKEDVTETAKKSDL